MPKRFLGVFLNALYAQVEGVDAVLDRIQGVGAQAICVSPRVAWPSDEGKRFPDLHIDGWDRLVSRPVWGKGELQLQTAFAFEPDLSLYANGPYRPRPPALPRDVDATIPDRLIDGAKRRGMAVHAMAHPFLPPNLRDDDRPVLIDGSHPASPRVADNACPNSPAARAYGLALLLDLAQRYRSLDGLIPDWVEFGAYALADHFGCLCAHCERAAHARGYNWERLRRDVRALWEWCHALTPKELERSRRVLRNPSELIALLTRFPGWVEFLRFKAETVLGFYGEARQALSDHGFASLALTARGWPPPWNRSSGLDYGLLSAVCDAVAPKLFTFDYSALPRWYGQALLSWNPELDEAEVLDAMVDWMNLPDDHDRRTFALYNIPAPGAPHPAHIEAYRARLDEVATQVAGRAPCYPIAHAYLPEPHWKRMLDLIRDSSVGGLWVHMYGYLSEGKLQILRDVWA